MKVARETEKAVAVEVVFEAANAEREITRLMWFPKSMIEGGEGVALVPGWMIEERVDRARAEIEDSHRGVALGLILVSRGIMTSEEAVAA